MIIPVLAVLAVLALIAVLAWAMRSHVATESAKERSLRSDGTSTLTYLVPPGQDPAVLVSALERHGFDAEADVMGGPQRVLVGSPQGRPDREKVREVIEAAGTTTIDGRMPADRGRIRFEDEADRP